MATRKLVSVDVTYPLTTIFTAPDWCSTSFYTYHPLSTSEDGESYFFRAQASDNPRGFDPKYAPCYPPHRVHINELFTNTVPFRQGAIYSPGVCPAGYYSNPIPGSTASGVQSYACCPLGFHWHNNQACKSEPVSTTVVALNPTKNITVTPPYALLDWPINIAWATSDLKKFTPVSAPLILSKVTGTPDQGSSGGLSTGAIAGIGVGVGVVCLALIALLIFLLFFRKKHRERKQREQTPEVDMHNTSQEFYQYPKSPQTPASLPGYDSPRPESRMEFAKVGSGALASPISELSSEGKTYSELETPTLGNANVSPELDGREVYEAHGSQVHGISNDELGALGLAPATAVRGTRGRVSGIRRDVSNASSAYSTMDRSGAYTTVASSERSENDAPVISGTLQGRWQDYSQEYGYGNQR